MSVSPTSAYNSYIDTSAADGASATGSSDMDKQDFLLLLTTQLKYQDPMNPLQGSEFAAQLAQFSTVEALTNIQTTLETNNSTTNLLAQSMNSGVAAGLIGKMIDAESDAIQLSSEVKPTMRFKLDGDVKTVTITVKDSEGNTVRTISKGAMLKGEHEFTWDGLGNDGTLKPDGQYTYSIDAKDANGDAVVGTPLARGKVDKVTFGTDGITLWVGKTPVPLGKVTSVTNP